MNYKDLSENFLCEFKNLCSRYNIHIEDILIEDKVQGQGYPIDIEGSATIRETALKTKGLNKTSIQISVFGFDLKGGCID